LLGIRHRHDAQLVEFGAKETHVAILRKEKLRNRTVRKGGLEVETDLQARREIKPAAIIQDKLPDAERRKRDAKFAVMTVLVAFQIGVLDRVRQALSIGAVYIPGDVLD
jgi:hypothetical protein